MWVGFGGDEYTDLLFYDRINEEAFFYTTNGMGGISQLPTVQAGWRDTWTAIVPGTWAGRQLLPEGFLFSDGFESGDTSAWSNGVSRGLE